MKMRSLIGEITFLKTDDSRIIKREIVYIDRDLNPQLKQMVEIFGEPKQIKIACGRYEWGWLHENTMYIIKQ